MGYVASVLCRSKKPLTRDDIIEIFKNEFDFIDDHHATFEPASSPAKSWDRLDVHYDGDGLIQFRLGDKDLIEGVVEETVDESLSGPKLSKALVTQLRQTCLN